MSEAVRLALGEFQFRSLLKIGKKCTLFVTHSWGGGTESYLQNILKTEPDWAVLRSRTIFERKKVFTLEAGDSKEIHLSRRNVRRLGRIAKIVSVENLCGYKSPKFILDTVLDFSVPVRFKVHDFYSLCPTINLMKDGRFCNLATCSECAFTVEGKRCSAEKWQAMWQEFFLHADEIYFFSNSSRETMNIGIFGSIMHEAKGRSVVNRFLRFSEGKPYKIFINGTANASEISSYPKNCVYAGTYAPSEIHARLVEQRVGVAFFPSIWPETFSYVVSELMATGIPIACFDIGAQAEKVKAYPLGKIIPGASPEAILRTLEECFEEGRRYYQSDVNSNIRGGVKKTHRFVPCSTMPASERLCA